MERCKPEERLSACHLCRGGLHEIFAAPIVELVTSDCRPWRGENRVAYCSSCGLVQKPVSNTWKDEINDIYAGYEVYEQGGGAEQVSFDATTGGAASRSQRIVKWLTEQGEIPRTGALLDIGCGNGAFLRAFAGANPGWRMTGLELDARNKVAVESIPGVTHLHVKPITSLECGFDLIVMVHALEHIPCPDEFLRTVATKLNHGGRLLLQVPDLLTSPFDLLIADHCSHFSTATLERVVRLAGYDVCRLVTSCVAKEITLLAAPVTIGSQKPSDLPIPSDYDARVAMRHIDWLHEMLRHGQQLSNDVGIFGTSISGTWLASALSVRVKFFVDEDLNRVGRTHLTKPIYSPDQAPRGLDILMPMQQQVAVTIASRLAPYGLRLIIPPAPKSAPM